MKAGKLMALCSVMVLAALGLSGCASSASPEKAAGENAPPPQTAKKAGLAEAGSDQSERPNDGFILLKGGKVTIGSPDSERQRQKDETQHEVTLSPFYVDPYEVKQSDFLAVMGKNPSKFKGSDKPVENVTWYDAIEYCNRLSQRRGLTPVYTVDGGNANWDEALENYNRTNQGAAPPYYMVSWNREANGYRLLTEAEWEYAARAGTTTIFHFGSNVNSEKANFEGNYPYLIEENYVVSGNPDVVPSVSRGETIAVNGLPPNAFGLYNVHGNVAEWCFDYYGEYDLKNTVNPPGSLSGHLRINRGGGFNDFGKHLRSAYRSATNPLDGDENLGFRLARNAAAGSGTFTTIPDLKIVIPPRPKILIAYFSYSGNTKRAAKLLAEKTGADIAEIAMYAPYRGNIYEMSQIDLMNGIRPQLVTKIADMAQYDVILLGYPTWWATMPMPVLTFLESYDFSGKTILPFSSHGGTIFGDSVSDLAKAAPKSYIGIGFEFHYSGGGGLSAGLSKWLAQSGIKEK